MRVITLIAVITILIELITCKIAGIYYRASERDLRLFGTRRERKKYGRCQEYLCRRCLCPYSDILRPQFDQCWDTSNSGMLEKVVTLATIETSAKAGKPPAEGTIEQQDCQQQKGCQQQHRDTSNSKEGIATCKNEGSNRKLQCALSVTSAKAQGFQQQQEHQQQLGVQQH